MYGLMRPLKSYISATWQLFGEAESGKREFSSEQRTISPLFAPKALKLRLKTGKYIGRTQRQPGLVHFIGKDNIVFHCIIFPAMLHAHGEYILQFDNVPANEFVNLGRR